MNITKIEIKPKQNAGRLKAVASIVIDAEYALHDIAIIQGDHRLYVQFPWSTHNRDFFVPLTPAARKRIEHQILGEYKEHRN